jgi:hypothetical protein
MVATVETAAAAMIDPLLSPGPGRPVAARPQRRKRAMPARTSKIFTAGASATALFSMVAAMGWQSGAGAATTPDPTVDPAATTPGLVPAEAPTTIVLPVTVVLPAATTPTVPTPISPTPAVHASTPPVHIVPKVKVPVVKVVPVAKSKPVVIPRAVPVVTLPVQKVTKHKSNTTTRSSG